MFGPSKRELERQVKLMTAQCERLHKLVLDAEVLRVKHAREVDDYLKKIDADQKAFHLERRTDEKEQKERYAAHVKRTEEHNDRHAGQVERFLAAIEATLRKDTP